VRVHLVRRVGFEAACHDPGVQLLEVLGLDAVGPVGVETGIRCRFKAKSPGGLDAVTRHGQYGTRERRLGSTMASTADELGGQAQLRSQEERITRQASKSIAGLVFYDGGIWIRPRTYDRQIVKESGYYLRLRPKVSDILLDIGANIGAVSWRFLNAGVQRVVAVEPEPSNFSILQRNLASARNRSVLVQAAATSAKGSCRLCLNPGRNKGMHSLIPHNGRRTIEVRAVSVQQLIAVHRPTLIKIDIEGGEYGLVAPLSILPEHVRGLALELHFFGHNWRSHDAPAIIRRIEEQGFSAVMPPRLDGQRPCTLGIWLR